MKTWNKFYRYTLPGTHSYSDAQKVLGTSRSHMLVVRIDIVDDQTYVYVAASDADEKTSDAVHVSGADRPFTNVEEVSEKDITNFD